MVTDSDAVCVVTMPAVASGSSKLSIVSVIGDCASVGPAKDCSINRMANGKKEYLIA